MDFMQRLAATYLAFVITIPSIAWWMQSNGADYPGNPAWGLISGLRSIALGSVAILLLAAVVLVVSEITYNQAQETKRMEQVAEEWKQAEAARERHEAWEREDARREMQRKEQLRLERAEEKRAQQEAIERELEEKRNRTTEDAVDSALDEFG